MRIFYVRGLHHDCNQGYPGRGVVAVMMRLMRLYLLPSRRSSCQMVVRWDDSIPIVPGQSNRFGAGTTDSPLSVVSQTRIQDSKLPSMRDYIIGIVPR